MYYNQLVRDKIPDILLSKGEEPIIKVLTEAEYKQELEKKLRDVIVEVLSSGSSKERIDNLSDMIEVVEALAIYEGANLETVLKIKHDNFIERGGFSRKVFLINVK